VLPTEFFFPVLVLLVYCVWSVRLTHSAGSTVSSPCLERREFSKVDSPSFFPFYFRLSSHYPSFSLTSYAGLFLTLAELRIWSRALYSCSPSGKSASFERIQTVPRQYNSLFLYDSGPPPDPPTLSSTRPTSRLIEGETRIYVLYHRPGSFLVFPILLNKAQEKLRPVSRRGS